MRSTTRRSAIILLEGLEQQVERLLVGLPEAAICAHDFVGQVLNRPSRALALFRSGLFGGALFGVAVAQGLDFRCGTLAFGCGALALGGQYGFGRVRSSKPGACFGLGKAARLDRLRLFPEQTLGVAPQQRFLLRPFNRQRTVRQSIINPVFMDAKLIELFQFIPLSRAFCRP